jgi:hypothetical protein
MYHDSTQPVGLVTARQDTDAGMLFSARISGTAAGDEALTLALDGVLDAVSVGVNPTRFSYDDEGTMIVAAAEWLELSLVPIGAFSGAEIVEVYASSETENVLASATEPGTTETTPTQVEETVQVDTTPETENTIEAAAIPTAPIPAQPKRQFAMPSPGEYMAAFHIGGDTFRRVNEAYVEAAKSKQTALQAAAGDVLTTDTPGLLPVPVLGNVFENLNQSTRPVVAAVGARAMPDGGSQKTFIRPTWTTHTSVGAQANELTAVSATTPVIASNTISKTTIAGQVTLSVQDIDFTSPASLDIILNDLVGQYFRETDNFIADKMVADAGVSGVTWTFAATDPTDLLDSLYDVAESQLTATNFLPDHLFVSPDVWKKLSSQLDGDNRPVFPYVAAAGLMGINGFGTQNITTTSGMNPFGLNLVVDNQFASGTMILAQGRAIEFYEQVRGIQSVEQPSLLGRTFSYYGYVAGFIANTTLVSKIAVA